MDKEMKETSGVGGTKGSIAFARYFIKYLTIVSGLLFFFAMSVMFWMSYLRGGPISVSFNAFGEGNMEAVMFILLIPIIISGSLLFFHDLVKEVRETVR